MPSDVIEPAGPVFTAHLFAGLHREQMSLLRGLPPEDWRRPTRAGAWQVRDVAAHLLDGALRKLSFHRDGETPPPPAAPITDYASLLAHLNALNADWTRAAGRIGPRVLVDLLDLTGAQLAEFVAGLDPFAPALFSVAWAGEHASLNWLDTGREYTERWHHQQQIREAVGAPLLEQRQWLYPVLDVSARALPFAYREVEARPGCAIALVATGEAGGSWSLRREAEGWRLHSGEPQDPACRIVTDAATAWRVYFKAIEPADAASRVRIEGEARLGRTFLGTLAVMA
jgi:uncharacterized protein (TIGR03083 family)